MWRNLNGKDRITLCISVLALTVSGLTFYFSNLRVKDNFVARIVGVVDVPVPESRLAPDPVDTTHKEFEKGIQVALVNSGNRPAIVIDWSVRFYDEQGNLSVLTRAMGHEPNPFPLLISDRDLRLVTLHIPNSSWQSLVPLDGLTEPTSVPLEAAHEIRIGLRSIDSQGKRHEAWSRGVYRWSLDSHGRTRVGSSVAGWRDPIDLFAD